MISLWLLEGELSGKFHGTFAEGWESVRLQAATAQATVAALPHLHAGADGASSARSVCEGRHLSRF